MFGLIATTLAAPPFEMGPLEPLPVEPTDVGIYAGQVVLLHADGVQLRTEAGWEDAQLPGGRALLVEHDGLLICGDAGVTRVVDEPVVVSERPCTDVAAVADDVWILSTDGVYRLSDDTAVDLPKRPALIGGGTDRAWLEGNELTIGGSPRLIFPGATSLAPLRQGDAGWWVLVHPERKLIGRLGGQGLEAAWGLPFAGRHLAVGDLNGDGEQEVAVVGSSEWTTLTFAPPAPVVKPVPLALPAPKQPTITSPPRKRWEPPQTTSFLGIKMPNFAGLAPDPEYDALFIGGFGLALGRGVGPSQVAITFSPIGSAGVERGANRIRSYFGADTAPLFIFEDSLGARIHLAMATAGISLGSDRLRAGPFVSAGLLGAAVGMRAVFTPFESRVGKLTGLEARLTYFAPTTAHASLSYMNAFPLGRKFSDDKRPTVRSSLCHRFGFSLGAAGGFSSTEAAWEFVGRDAAYQTSWSPAATVSCESGTRATGWNLGLDTAPMFFYRVPVANGGADKRLVHSGSMTFGAYAGTDSFRVGPIATAGVWTIGGGVRAIVTPFKTKQGAWHGLELRAMALFPSAPAFQGMAMYHVWFDPKADRKPPALPNPLSPSTEAQ